MADGDEDSENMDALSLCVPAMVWASEVSSGSEIEESVEAAQEETLLALFDGEEAPGEALLALLDAECPDFASASATPPAPGSLLE